MQGYCRGMPFWVTLVPLTKEFSASMHQEDTWVKLKFTASLWFLTHHPHPFPPAICCSAWGEESKRVSWVWRLPSASPSSVAAAFAALPVNWMADFLARGQRRSLGGKLSTRSIAKQHFPMDCVCHNSCLVSRAAVFWFFFFPLPSRENAYA